MSIQDFFESKILLIVLGAFIGGFISLSLKKYIEPALPDSKVLGKKLSYLLKKIAEFSFIYWLPVYILYSSKWFSAENYDSYHITLFVIGTALLFFCIVLHYLFYVRKNQEVINRALKKKIDIINGEDIETLRNNINESYEKMEKKTETK